MSPIKNTEHTIPLIKLSLPLRYANRYQVSNVSMKKQTTSADIATIGFLSKQMSSITAMTKHKLVPINFAIPELLIRISCSLSSYPFFSFCTLLKISSLFILVYLPSFMCKPIISLPSFLVNSFPKNFQKNFSTLKQVISL